MRVIIVHPEAISISMVLKRSGMIFKLKENVLPYCAELTKMDLQCMILSDQKHDRRMKISNETKVGALTAIAITLLILGFNF